MSDFLVLLCTNRPNALTATVGHFYAKTLHALGAKVDLINLQDLPADFAGPSLYLAHAKQPNPSLAPFLKKLEKATKVVFILPEYNGSYPGVLKAFFDGLPDGTYAGKKAVILGISAGRGGGRLPAAHWGDVLRYFGFIRFPKEYYLSQLDPLASDLEKYPTYKTYILKQAKAFLSF